MKKRKAFLYAWREAMECFKREYEYYLRKDEYKNNGIEGYFVWEGDMPTITAEDNQNRKYSIKLDDISNNR